MDYNESIVDQDCLIKDNDYLGKENRSRSPLCSQWIDVDMIPTKLTYLFWGGLIGTYIMYLNPFLVSVGLTKSKVGAITGIGYALSSLSGPLWGLVTDHTGKPKVVLFVLCISAAMWVFFMPFIAAIISDQDINKSCTNHSASEFAFNTKGIDPSNGSAISSSNTTNTIPLVNGVADGLNSTGYDCNDESADMLFYTLLIIIPLGAIFFNNIQNYIDATALKVIKVSRRGATYGAQRIFGAIGATASIFMTGFLVERFQFEGLSDFSMAFFVFVPFPLILIPMSWLLVSQYERNIKSQQTTTTATTSLNIKEETLQNEEKKGVMHYLCEMCSQAEVIILMINALVAGASFHLFIYFTMFLMLDKMDVTVSEAGFVFSGLNVANILMFPLTGIIIKFLGGPRLAIVIGLFAHCGRNIVMSYTSTYWVMLAVQALHCFNFALFWSAMMDYVHEISHREIVTTMIMILQSIHFGFSPFLMNVAGGVLYQMFGGDLLFFGGGVVCGVWAIILSVYYGTYGCRKKAGEREKAKFLLRNEGPWALKDQLIRI